MRNVLVGVTIPVGLMASAAWVAFIAFELVRLAASLFKSTRSSKALTVRVARVLARQ